MPIYQNPRHRDFGIPHVQYMQAPSHHWRWSSTEHIWSDDEVGTIRTTSLAMGLLGLVPSPASPYLTWGGRFLSASVLLDYALDELHPHDSLNSQRGEPPTSRTDELVAPVVLPTSSRRRRDEQPIRRRRKKFYRCCDFSTVSVVSALGVFSAPSCISSSGVFLDTAGYISRWPLVGLRMRKRRT